jgi:hypothetical protein
MSKDFEQQAKKQGDGFSLQPRQQVWTRIETALDEKKRRGVAWWIWALPLALILGSGFGYYFYGPANTTAVADTDRSQKIIVDRKGNTETVSIPGNQSDHPSSATPNTPDKQTTHSDQAIAKKEPFEGSAPHRSSTTSHTRTHSVPKNSKVGNESKQQDLHPIAPAPVPTTTVLSSAEAPGTPQVITGTGEDKSSVAFNSQPTIADSSSLIVPGAALVTSSVPASAEIVTVEQSKATETPEPAETNFVKTETVDSSFGAVATGNKSGVKPVALKKATWFVQAGIGKARMGAFDLLPGGEKAFASDPLQSGNGSSFVSSPPKTDEAGLAFSLGLQRRQALGKRWQWQASIGWQHQEVKQYLGNKVDSTIVLDASRYLSNSFFYQPGNNIAVKGTNDRILLSNDFSWQVLKNQPWLRLSGGLYTGFNISNNYYVRTNAQRMVKNDGLYSNWIFGFTPGIEFSYKNKLTLGAYSHFDFTRAYEELNSTTQYWRGWEIKAGISIFNK